MKLLWFLAATTLWTNRQKTKSANLKQLPSKMRSCWTLCVPWNTLPPLWLLYYDCLKFTFWCFFSSLKQGFFLHCIHRHLATGFPKVQVRQMCRETRWFRSSAGILFWSCLPLHSGNLWKWWPLSHIEVDVQFTCIHDRTEKQPNRKQQHRHSVTFWLTFFFFFVTSNLVFYAQSTITVISGGKEEKLI